MVRGNQPMIMKTLLQKLIYIKSLNLPQLKMVLKEH